jgi:hypothetical protein
MPPWAFDTVYVSTQHECPIPERSLNAYFAL